MLNHFIDFAGYDQTAFIALQEGAEHKHHDDRVDIETTLRRGIVSHVDGRNSFQQLLDQQEIRSILVHFGFAPPEETPQDISHVRDDAPLNQIDPPVFHN